MEVIEAWWVHFNTWDRVLYVYTVISKHAWCVVDPVLMTVRPTSGLKVSNFYLHMVSLCVFLLCSQIL